MDPPRLVVSRGCLPVTEVTARNFRNVGTGGEFQLHGQRGTLLGIRSEMGNVIQFAVAKLNESLRLQLPAAGRGRDDRLFRDHVEGELLLGPKSVTSAIFF